ncbi:DUF4148 domain-containing protein [Paraburkholderia dipogonis]|uniref:DUF4148 domain-containing protein n=1 Tax=Paraburkholderia dipogonis TaxID=1211383 RepID=A0ABW9B851_9BURK
MVASALAAPAVSFAQDTTAPVSHAQVRADLVQVEQTGYRPSAKDVYYPADIPAAQARLHGQDMSSTAVGGVSMDGSSPTERCMLCRCL